MRSVGAGEGSVVDGPDGGLSPTPIVELGDELVDELCWCCFVSSQFPDSVTRGSMEGQ